MREQYIKVMQGLANGVTIFEATGEFWGKVYDSISSNQTGNIDDWWISPFVALKYLNDNFTLIPKFGTGMTEDRTALAEKYAIDRRLCLTAIEHRINGEKVAIVVGSLEEKRRLTMIIAKLVESLPQDLLKQRYVDYQTILGLGELTIVAYRHGEFDWSRMLMMGRSSDHIHLVTQAAVMKSHSQYIDVYKRFTDASNCSEFVITSEEKIKQAAYMRGLLKRQRSAEQAFNAERSNNGIESPKTL